MGSVALNVIRGARRPGLLFRPSKEHARLGIDSIAVLAVYVLGVAGLIVLPQ